MILCENGYLEYDVPITKNVFINGYFQSDKYFDDIRNSVLNEISMKNKEDIELESIFPEIKQIRNRNSVCISELPLPITGY